MRRRIASVIRPCVLLLASGMPAGPLAAQSATRTASAATPGPRAESPAASGDNSTTLPLSYPRAARFTTDEGTWLSLDVSPDGRTIVFDLAGDLYTLPIGGGRATRITDGPGYDAQPRFSPDGQRIVFQSDRSGAENLYTVRPDGQDLKALTTGEGQAYRSPVWTPDGQHLVVSRGKYGGDVHLYRYPKDGGAGTSLSGPTPQGSTPATGGNAPGGAMEPLGAAFGSDARWLYYSTKGKRLPAGNLTEFVWKIQRYNLETGEQQDVAMADGGAFRPLLSPNGQWLVYATRYDTATSLRLLDFVTGRERWLVHGVQRDDQEADYTRDLMPGSAFTPDSKAIITAYNGKIWRVEVPSGRATMIPFAAEIDVPLGERVHFEYSLDDSTLTVRGIRDPRLSPNNRRVVFTALDRLYVMDLSRGTPRRLTRAEVGEYHPVWSPDGKWIAYVTWDDSSGAVYRVRADGRDAPERLTREDGFYQRVAYNPSGSRLLVWRAAQPWWFGRPSSPQAKASLIWLPATGGEGIVVLPRDSTSEGSVPLPYFVNGDSTRIYLGTESVRWNGMDRKSHLRDRSLRRKMFSPNGKRLFAESGAELWLGTTPSTPDIPFEIAPPGAPLVGRQVSGSGSMAEFTAWSPDGTKLTWAGGRFLFIYDIARGDSAVADSLQRAAARQASGGAESETAKAARVAYEAKRIEVKVTLPKDRPRGVVALRNARIVTMRGDEVLERGDLVVTNNRITAVGPAGSVPLPAGAKLIDLAGKTLIPGLVDIHAHPKPPTDIHPKPWQYAAALAYGVTTIRDPQSGWGSDVLTYSDLVEAGMILGPRSFYTGLGVNGEPPDFKTLSGARTYLRRYSEMYQSQTVKAYRVGERKARQHFLMAAKELGLTPTLEGAGDFEKNITEAIDGYAGSEHAYPIMPLYRDMVELVARSGITYTPTLLVSYGGPLSENYLYVKYQGMHDDPKLQRFVPHRELDKRFLRREQWFADGQYVHQQLAAQAAKILRAGGRVGLGGHGQLPGLGEQWELWLLQSGGMRPIDALRCATLFGADAIGHGKDLGSLEVGKLADLLVLDKNPLDDIHHTLAIHYVMKNGRLYDGNTLDEVWPRQQPMKRDWWTE